MAEYGIPYMGSKGKICNDIVRIFPKADHFYDLFGGGFSVTHAMLLRRPNDFKQFHFNEIRPGICDLIQRAISGEFNYSRFKPQFISREEFALKVETDAMIKMLWSFGNNGKNYLFSKEIEPYKLSMHNAIVFNEFDSLARKVLGMDAFGKNYSVYDRRLFLRNRIEFYRKTGLPDFLLPFIKEEQTNQLKQLERLEQLEQLERLEQLEQLERLQQLERLYFSSVSYEKVKIENNSVVYCDPPYAGTASYDGEFDYKKFLDWCAEKKCPVYISEYDIPDERFVMVKSLLKKSLLGKGLTLKTKIEKIYVNRAGYAAMHAKSPVPIPRLQTMVR